MDWIQSLADGFVLRGHCGDWNSTMKFLYAFARLNITGAYVAIPAISVWAFAVRQKVQLEDLTPRELTIMRLTYAAFIVFCGVGHLEGVLAFVWPAYHVFAVWHLATATVSWFAVAVTFRHRLRLVTGI